MADGKKFCTECGTPVSENSANAGDVGAINNIGNPGELQVRESEPAEKVRQTVPVYQREAQSNRTQRKPSPKKVSPDDSVPGPGSPYEPITAGGYIGIMLLMCIPVVGLVLMIVWACGGCRKVNKRNLAKASLIMMVIGMVFGLIFGIIARVAVNKAVKTIEDEVGVSLSGEEEKGGLLGLLAGAASSESGTSESGSGQGSTGSTNSDLEELEELGNLLESLEKLSGEESGASGLNDLVENVEEINQEAEKMSDGWPKSLRAYPGGTATATASYRTEITGTSQEEMMSWIEDLKKDGYSYQDFYGFGMTEEDMLSFNGWWATDGEIYLSVSYVEDTVIIDHMTELPDMSSLFGE